MPELKEASSTDAQMKLRIPAELRKQIKVRAAENTRTMNSEVLHLLKKAIAQGAAA